MEHADSPNASLPRYSQCADCGRILRSSRTPAPRLPCCGSGAPARPWPPAPVLRLLEAGETEFSTSVVFLCAALQLLLESCIADLLRPGAGSPGAAETVLNRGIATLIKFFDEIHETPLSGLFERAGMDGLSADISRLFALRSRVIQDPGHLPSAEEAALVSSARARLLDAFAFVQNRIRDGFPAPAGGAAGGLVLIVDDENDAASFIGRFVRRQGFEVLTAGTGREALRLFGQSAPACVFLDVSLPDMSGLAILEKMKAADPGARVYFVTGISGDAFTREAQERGAAGILTKPVDLSDLLKVVKAVRAGPGGSGTGNGRASPPPR